MQANSGSDEDDLCFSLPRAPSGVPPLWQGVICQVLLFVPLIACLVSFSACGTNSVTSPPSPFVAPTPLLQIIHSLIGSCDYHLIGPCLTL